MDLWALQTSRPNPNPCPLPWVSDYKVIPPSLSCSNWISLRDLWKLTSANAALLSQKTPRRKYKLQRVWEKHAQWLLFFPVSPAESFAAGDGRLSPRRRRASTPQVRPACRGQPGCQVASLPAGWARSNQGCGAQLELPTSAPLELGWLKAKLCSVCT